MPLSFRRATPDDIRACVILRGLTRENAIPVERLAAMGITEESWSADVRSDALPGYVCCDDEAIVGYCFGDKASGEVVVLALLPAYEDRGIGRHLLVLVVAHLAEGRARTAVPRLRRRPGHPISWLLSASRLGLHRHVRWRRRRDPRVLPVRRKA